MGIPRLELNCEVVLLTVHDCVAGHCVLHYGVLPPSSKFEL